MRMLTFAKRNFKEIVRDPVSVIFCIGLPLFLLFIFQQFDIPAEVYKIENFAPSIVVFSFCFISLFTSQLISKDRTSSFLSRLFSSPMTSKDFIIGYSISVLPIALIQSILFFSISLFLGLKLNINILYTILISMPLSLLFVSLGILIGCAVNDKTSPGISSIIIQLVVFTSGMWFDTNMVGKFFQSLCNVLPFRYVVDITRATISGSSINWFLSIAIILVYTITIYALSIFIFKKKMRS